MLATALTLAQKHMAVFPCRPRTKWPATANGLKDATVDLDVIRQWWHANPNYNVAIATGAASRIFVIDIDGLDAEIELRKLEAEYGTLPASVEVITARGRHVYFQQPAQEIRNSASKIAPGIDVRGDGGYVLVPPSIHPSGRQYAWSVDTGNSVADAPAWLLTRANGGNSGKLPTPAAEWQSLVRDGVSEGSRNDNLTRLAGYLLRRHIDALVATEIVLAVNDARCRPPLERDEVITIIDSIAAREMKRRGIR